MVELRPATAEDLRAFYGKAPPFTCRAVVGVVDGKPVGIGGIGYAGSYRAFFCDLKPEARRYKVAIVKAARVVLSMATGRTFAAASPDEPGAPRWLERMGFQRIGSGPAGQVYEWAP